ncbi:MAG: hypothetical protein ACTSRS_18885 [Candidatus Helarchaeota archaeon]
MEAVGYECVDWHDKHGLWGDNPRTFFFRKLGRDLWPIDEKIVDYDEITLFTLIEFLYDYVSQPDLYFHKWYDCGWHASRYDKESGQEKYRNEVNEVLKRYKVGYQLSEEGEIQILPPSGLEPLVEETVKTDEPEDIDDRIERAKSLFLKFNAIPEDKKEAIRTLGDVLEYLKKDGITLSKKDDSDLFQILNRFSIRHHNKLQQSDYDTEIFYDWIFYEMLASIYALLKISEKAI